MCVTCCSVWPWRCEHYDPSRSQELRVHWHAVSSPLPPLERQCASLLDSLNFDTLWYYGSSLTFCRNTLCHLIGASGTCCGHVWEFLLKTTELVRDLERADSCINVVIEGPTYLLWEIWQDKYIILALYKHILYIATASLMFRVETFLLTFSRKCPWLEPSNIITNTVYWWLCEIISG